MAKAKKVEKRSTPKKAVKKGSVARAVEATQRKKSERLEFAEKELDRLFKNEPGKAKRLVKLTKTELAEESKQQKTPVLRGVKFEARYPEREPKKPPEPEAPKIEVTVRTVYYDGQYLPALCFRKPGALHTPCVSGDPVNGVRKFTIPASQHDKSTILQHGYGNFAAPYTPERFAGHMKKLVTELHNPPIPVQPEARSLLLPYCPDMPAGPAALPGAIGATPDAEAQPVARRIASGNGSRAPSGPVRTSGKELIRTLADASGLPPEKVRAKLRAAGMRAPYTDEAACRKALDVNGPTKIPEPRRKKA